MPKLGFFYQHRLTERDEHRSLPVLWPVLMVRLKHIATNNFTTGNSKKEKLSNIRFRAILAKI